MFSIIAAMTGERVIGREGRLPWNIPDEMELFNRITLAATVLMGRKTFESTGRLNGRRNVIVSRVLGAVDGANVCRSVSEGLGVAASYGLEVFIIGGAEIFSQTIGIADRMYLSYIKREYVGDTFFPEFDEREWKERSRSDYKEFEQRVYARKTHSHSMVDGGLLVMS